MFVRPDSATGTARSSSVGDIYGVGPGTVLSTAIAYHPSYGLPSVPTGFAATGLTSSTVAPASVSPQAVAIGVVALALLAAYWHRRLL